MIKSFRVKAINKKFLFNNMDDKPLSQMTKKVKLDKSNDEGQKQRRY